MFDFLPELLLCDVVALVHRSFSKCLSVRGLPQDGRYWCHRSYITQAAFANHVLAHCDAVVFPNVRHLSFTVESNMTHDFAKHLMLTFPSVTTLYLSVSTVVNKWIPRCLAFVGHFLWRTSAQDTARGYYQVSRRLLA